MLLLCVSFSGFLSKIKYHWHTYWLLFIGALLSSAKRTGWPLETCTRHQNITITSPVVLFFGNPERTCCHISEFKHLSQIISGTVRWLDGGGDGASAYKRVAQPHFSSNPGADDVVHRCSHRFCLRCNHCVGANRQHHTHQDVLLCQIRPKCAESLHVESCARGCFTAGDLRSGGCQPLPVRGVAVRQTGL